MTKIEKVSLWSPLLKKSGFLTLDLPGQFFFLIRLAIESSHSPSITFASVSLLLLKNSFLGEVYF